MTAMQHETILGHVVGALADQLARCGVVRACICPGSRSTPMALALWHHPEIKTSVHLDERGAAFFALGAARASRRPVVVLTTSGTAAANLLPATAEADLARVPLLLLTADRPPELQEAGAPQTIDQVGLLGSRVRWATSLPVPEAGDEAIRFARVVATRAVASATAPPPGPVHLNLPFREPLVPELEALARSRTEPIEDPGTGEHAPRVEPVSAPAPLEPTAADVRQLVDRLVAARRPLVLAGPQDDPNLPSALTMLAARLEAPILADVLSGLRRGPHTMGHVIDAAEPILRDADLAARLRPDLVVRFGAVPVSKASHRLLAGLDEVPSILVDVGQGWRDPFLTTTRLVRADPTRLCRALVAALGTGSATHRPHEATAAWRCTWSRLGRVAREAIDARLDAEADEGRLSEPGATRELLRRLPAGATLVAGNSLPIRHCDLVCGCDERPLEVLANRGASGIDGVVSTALGVASASDSPVALLIGDLSLLHDLNGLLAARGPATHRPAFGQRRPGLTILVLDNDGGGIFSLLPQTGLGEAFEPLFGTPHGIDLEQVARLLGLTWSAPTSYAELDAAIDRSLSSPGVSLIAVRTSRARTAEDLERLWQAAASACREAY